jgi:SAM-dependent methyltransferase
MIEKSVAQLYDTFPFPPDPVLDAPPPGYNWRWSWQSAYGFCTGGWLSPVKRPRILDAGCGSGVSTEYLAHLNPTADIAAIDISAGTLAVAQERIRKTVPKSDRSIEFHQLSLFDLAKLESKFHLINSVGVIHHTPDPTQALQCLAEKLEAGGLLHLFVYAEIGRWEIRLVQSAIALLAKSQPNLDFRAGVQLGRELFATLPETNRLVQREKTRWSLENQKDECFADMYLHPHEVNFTIDSLFAMIADSGLEFAGFSNPEVWKLERLLGKNPRLLALAQSLTTIEQYRLLELLDTDIAHYEFFLYRPPLPRLDLQDRQTILSAIPLRHPCIHGWESKQLFDMDYRVVHLTEDEFTFMQSCDGDHTVAQILAAGTTDDWHTVESLIAKHMILLQKADA